MLEALLTTLQAIAGVAFLVGCAALLDNLTRQEPDR